MRYPALPLLVLKFWYLEAPIGIILFFKSLNGAFLELFSLPLLLRTLFKPIKNEYREGLIGFSIAMGFFLKSFVIFADLLLLFLLVAIELVVLFAFLAFPVGTIWLLFI